MKPDQKLEIAVTLKRPVITAIDRLKAKYITLPELCAFFGMEERRVKDLISLHKNDGKFIKAFKVSAGQYIFEADDVNRYIRANATTET